MFLLLGLATVTLSLVLLATATLLLDRAPATVLPHSYCRSFAPGTLLLDLTIAPLPFAQDGDDKLSYVEFEHIVSRAPDFSNTFRIRI